MAIVFINQQVGTVDNGTSLTITLPGTPASTDILFGCFGTTGGGADITGITGATWSKVAGAAINTAVEFWIGTLPTGSDQVVSFPALNVRGNISQWSGVSSTLDLAALTHSGTGALTPLGNCVGGTRTTVTNNTLLISMISTLGGGPNAWTLVAGGFTLLTGEAPATNPQMGAAYQIVSATGTYGPTFNTAAGQVGFDDIIVAYRASALAVGDDPLIQRIATPRYFVPVQFSGRNDPQAGLFVTQPTDDIWVQQRRRLTATRTSPTDIDSTPGGLFVTVSADDELQLDAKLYPRRLAHRTSI